jgi:tetratricopeptide (TPR) repeat protein
MRAVLIAMLGRIDEAMALAVPADEQARELGINSGSTWLSEIALIAGDEQVAADYLRATCEGLEQSGANAQLSTYTAQLGRVLCALGRPDEAERFAEQGRDLGDPDDVLTQALWRQALALVHSARAEHTEAVRLAREGLEWCSKTDSPLREANAHCDLAQVLEAAGRRDEAIDAWKEALACYERKGVIPLAGRIRERLTTSRCG